MKYKTCPHCGAHLDHGEKCDCEKKKEGTPAGTGAPSKEQISTKILSEPSVSVNDCLRLKEICEKTGAMNKEIALVVRDEYPKFNRQLLSQCQASDKYGIMIHPNALAIICDAYGQRLQASSEPEVPSEPPSVPPAKKKPMRRLQRKLTFRMTNRDYAKLLCRIEDDHFDSVQAWLYDIIINQILGGSESGPVQHQGSEPSAD